MDAAKAKYLSNDETDTKNDKNDPNADEFIYDNSKLIEFH